MTRNPTPKPMPTTPIPKGAWWLLIGLGALIVFFFSQSQKVMSSAPAAPYGTITAAEFGSEWPFTVSSGVLRCEGSDGFGAVTFETGGVTYSVNGTAKSQAERRGWNDDIFSIVDDGSVGPIIQRGLEDCR